MLQGSAVRSARRLKTAGRAGFTLVELLAAVTILAIALAAYLNVSLVSRAAADKGRFFTLASQIAGDKLADYQGMGYADLPANGTAASAVSTLPNGSLTVTIGPLDGNAANTNIRQIDIKVSWGYANSALPMEAGSIRQSLLLSAYP